MTQAMPARIPAPSASTARPVSTRRRDRGVRSGHDRRPTGGRGQRPTCPRRWAIDLSGCCGPPVSACASSGLLPVCYRPERTFRTCRESGAAMRVVVVGAGFGGLACADELIRAGHEVVVLEARDRVGGRVWSSTVEGPLGGRGRRAWRRVRPRRLRRAACALRPVRPRGARHRHDLLRPRTRAAGSARRPRR